MKKKLSLIVLFCAAFFSTAVAQSTGKITGVITEAGTNETLPTVSVYLMGTSKGAATDLDGRYTITNVSPGEYNLKISFIGFKEVVIAGIKVVAGETLEINQQLEEKIEIGEEVIVIGEAPIFDVEKSNTSVNLNREALDAAPIQRVEDAVSMQSGVVKDPTGLYIKGGRAYETGFVVDGVSAQDPLAGTGFGLDLGSNSFSNVEVITGGVGAEYGDVTSGVVAVKTQDGGDRYEGVFSHKRDNLGSNQMDNQANWFEDIYEFNFGGPGILAEKILPKLGLDLPGNITFFLTAQVGLTDGYTKSSANQIRSSTS